MKKFLPFLVSLILLTGCGLFSKEYIPGHNFADQNELLRVLDTEDWDFELTNVSGSYVPRNFNAYGFGFQVRGDSIRSYLPFFGVSYRAPAYGSNEGPLTFEAPIVSYSVAPGPHEGEATVEIVTRKEPRNEIIYYISAFTNGVASLTMVSSDTQSLQFRGNIFLPDERSSD